MFTGCNKVILEPPLLHSEQTQLSKSFLTGEEFHPSDHLWALVWPLVLWEPPEKMWGAWTSLDTWPAFQCADVIVDLCKLSGVPEFLPEFLHHAVCEPLPKGNDHKTLCFWSGLIQSLLLAGYFCQSTGDDGEHCLISCSLTEFSFWWQAVSTL